MSELTIRSTMGQVAFRNRLTLYLPAVCGKKLAFDLTVT